MSDIDAVILCAGLGTRLRPLTAQTAKPAVPLLGRPLVGYGMALLRSAGLRRVFINTHWQPESMAEAARTEARELGLQLGLSHETEILGTGGAFRRLRERGLVPRDRHLLVLNGDVLFDVDLLGVLRAHRESGALATMVLRPMPAGWYTPVERDETGRVTRIGSHGTPGPGPGLLFTGVHVLSPEALDLIPEGACGIVETVYAPLLAAGKLISSVVEPGRWLDLGDPAGYLSAHLELQAGEWPLTRHGIARPPPVSPRANVHRLAEVVRSCVGAGAVVGQGASLDACVVWPGAKVTPGETLRRTIVTPHVRVAVPATSA